ncbi:MAG TPA: ATP-binding protein [Ktedonobacterales bacterium]|nr:ATP-binding protein [Ktedonobacterales bacterium]
MLARHPARFFRSVRFRLTLWYLALLAVIIGAFGLTVYYAQEHTLATQFDDMLRTRVQQIALTYNATTQQLDVTATDPQKPGTVGTISTVTRGLNINEVGVLISPTGEVLQNLGNLTPGSVHAIVSMALKASTDTTRGPLALSRLPDETLTVTTSGKPDDYGLVGMSIVQQQRVVAYLAFGMPTNDARQLSSLAMTLLIAGILVLLLAATGGFWLAGRAMRPVQTITATAQQIEASDLGCRLALKRRDELGELADTFDHMLDRLESAFTRQRQFTADASHELRTPLTIIELKASRLLDHGDLTDCQRADLTVIQQERQHMTHLVDDLLFLARTDAGHAQARHENVHLDELILEVVERFAPLAQERHLRVEVGDLPDLTVFGDRLYLLRMLGNLVENALKYSGPDGTCVRLNLAPCERDNAQWARLTVSDDGPGIPANHLPHVFERFYRADTSRTHSDAASTDAGERAGSGLGLAIARWIAQAHDGDITIDSSVDKGTVCAILLPLAAGD